ncbi:MAG: hypothetical protein WDO70_02825 [Alphaproteobacteria bacterium]
MSSLKAFHNSVKNAEYFRKKQGLFFSRNSLSKRDIHLAYETVFLSCFVSFERFLENQFIYFMCAKSHSVVKRRIEFKNQEIAREMLYHKHSYIDLVPYYKSLKVADLYFQGGKPFRDLDIDLQKNIDHCQVIRNAIAHKSKSSLSAFNDKILTPYGLARNIKTPAEYLRSQFSLNETRFDNHISILLTAAIKLA